MDDLPEIYHLPLISLNDFPAFVEILASDNEFPATFDVWEIHISAREDEILGAGHVPKFTSVNPVEFRQYVNRSTVSATLKTLVAYVVLLGSEARRQE